MKVFLKLVGANFKDTLRDPMLLFWFLLFPVVFAVVFGFLFSDIDFSGGNGSVQAGNNTEELSVVFNIGLVNDNSDHLNKIIEDQIKTIPMFNVHVGNSDEEIKEFEAGNRNVVIVFPDDLSKRVTEGKTINIPVYFDNQGASVLYGISEIFNGVERNVTSRPHLFSIELHNDMIEILNPAGTGSNTESQPEETVAQEVSGNILEEDKMDETAEDESVPEVKAYKQIDYTLPGVLAITLMQLGLFGSLRVISLRTQKTLKSLGTTPLSRGSFLASEITVRLVLSLIQTVIIIVIGHFLFDLTISSNWIYIFGWALLGVASFVSIGYMLTTFAKTVDSGNALMQVVQFPMMFLSGIFIPPEQMPDFLKPIVNIIPLAYLSDGFRHVMTGMPSAYGMANNFIILLAVTVACIVVAVFRFSWE